MIPADMFNPVCVKSKTFDCISYWNALIPAAEAFARCGECKHLGRGKRAGRCLFERRDRQYPPIQSVEPCPMAPCFNCGAKRSHLNFEHSEVYECGSMADGQHRAISEQCKKNAGVACGDEED